MHEHLNIDQIIAGLMDGAIRFEELSPEQFGELADWEPPPILMNSFDLSVDEQRQRFLYQYQWKGDQVLFPAVAHIWNSLEGQRGGHCILVGLLSGTGGKGKNALRLTLQQFLADCLDGPDMIPKAAEFGSLEEWNRAVQNQWSGEEERVLALCARYSAILDGRCPCDRSPSDPVNSANGGHRRPAAVILGPWRSAQLHRDPSTKTSSGL